MQSIANGSHKIRMQRDFDFDNEEREEQQENLERVASRITGAIVTFCEAHLRNRVSHQFHIEDLRRYVNSVVGVCAPDSAGRILRYLRQRGVLQYRVINRRESLYEIVSVKRLELVA